MSVSNISIKDLLVNSNEIEEDFSCPVCCDLIYKKEMLQCSNGHLFCKDCWIESLRRKRECISCRMPISIEYLSRNRAIENLFLKNKVNCLYSFTQYFPLGSPKKKDENGCKEVILLENFERHIGDCLYKIVYCGNSIFGCREMVRKGLLSSHLEECKYGYIKCNYCNQNVIKLNLQNHVETECLGIPIKCVQNCGMENIKKGDMKLHIENDCQLSIIDCKYKDGGCNKRFIRSKQYAHYHKTDHLKYMEKIIENNSNQIKTLKYMISDINKKYTYKKNEIVYSNSLEIKGFTDLIKEASLFPNKNIYSQTFKLDLGPFQVNLLCRLNRSSNEITLIYQEDSFIKDHCMLYFSLYNFKNISFINKENKLSFEFDRVTNEAGWISETDIFKVNFFLIYIIDIN